MNEQREDWSPKYLDIVAVVFVSSLLISNIAAQKLFALGPATFSAGILVFPISYIVGDVLTEVYGFRRARRLILAGLFANLFMAVLLWIAIQLPPASGWTLQDSFAAVHALIPRIVLASVVAYFAGEVSNSYVLSRLKVRTEGRHLWLRTICSTLIGQFIDTALFVSIAFAGQLPTSILIAACSSGWLFKVLYEAVATPFTYIIVNRLKALEGVDHFDR